MANLSIKESLRLDQRVVHVDHEDAEEAKGYRIHIEGHREIWLWDLDEHSSAVNGLPGVFCPDDSIILGCLEVLTIQDWHVHNVEAALRVIRVLFELHQALLDAKGDDQLSPRWHHKFRDCDDTFRAVLFLVDVVV